MSLHLTGGLEDILKKLGWNDGFQIPIANAENKALEEELAMLSLKKTKVKNNVDRVSERLESIKDHFKHVFQENEQNQKLFTAHKQQYENEEHTLFLLKAEKQSVEYDMKDTLKQLKDLDERQIQKKNDLQKGVAKAELLKTETDWDAEALRAWEESLKKRVDDNELIKQFSMEDERKYNEWEAKRQLLQVECDRQKNLLNKMIAEANNYEMIVERTGKVLREQVTERNALVKQWKDTVKMLQQRDNDIVKAQEEISTTHEAVEKQKELLEDEKGFLRNEQKNNRELDLETQNLNLLNSRQRKEYNELTQHVLLLNSELQTLKREVTGTSQELENTRIKGRQITHTIKTRHQISEKYQEDIQRLQQKLNEMKCSTMSSEDKIKKMEMMLEFEEKQYNIFIADTEKLNSVLYRAEKLLKEQVSISKTLVLGISNATCHCNHLRKHIANERKNLEQAKEIVYNMEYRIGDYERALCKIERDLKKDDFSDEKEKQIEELDKVLADHKDVFHTLQNQVTRLQEEMHRLTNAIALDKEQLAILQDKCEQHLLVNEISKKHIAIAKRSTQEKQVEENMMRLRLNQIDNDMKKEEKQIYSMEKLRLNLDQAMKERQLEINTNKIIIQTKRRTLEEDQGRLKADIVVRRLKIVQIQKKYHIALMAMGKDEDGQPLSVTHFKIKNAQEKFFLQQQGDELDKKIKITEKEIVAMENTLKLVNLTNTAFKISLGPVRDTDAEVQEMEVLNEELKQKSFTMRECKRELEKQLEEDQEEKTQLKRLIARKGELEEIVLNLEDDVKIMQQQATDKANKVKRAEVQIKKILKRLVKKDITNFNRDFEIRQMRDGNKNVMHRIREVSMVCPETAPLFHRYLKEYNILLPDKKSSFSSSSSSSSSSITPSKGFSSAQKLTNTARSDVSSIQGPSIISKVHLTFNL